MHLMRHVHQISVIEMLDWYNETIQTHYLFSDYKRWKYEIESYVVEEPAYGHYHEMTMEEHAKWWSERCVYDYYDCLELDSSDILDIVEHTLGKAEFERLQLNK